MACLHILQGSIDLNIFNSVVEKTFFLSMVCNTRNQKGKCNHIKKKTSVQEEEKESINKVDLQFIN